MPPKQLRLNDVPKYLFNDQGIKVCRATVFNWAKTGVRGIYLRTTTVRRGAAIVQVTTTGWVDEFVKQCEDRIRKS